MPRAPKKVFTGPRRQRLKKLLTAIRMLRDQDMREYAQALEQERTADIMFWTNTLNLSAVRLEDQAESLLALKR